MTRKRPKILGLGCTGPVAENFLHGFLDLGVDLHLLARTPDEVQKRYTDATVISGSMSDASTVSSAVSDADVVFMMTPLGARNNPQHEIEVGRKAIEGVKQGKAKHLVYLSVLGADTLRGVGMLDAKYEVERMIRDCNIPYTILRCGTFMQDLFEPMKPSIEKGRFPFPLDKSRHFAYTSQKDIPRFIVDELIRKKRVLNDAIDFVSPKLFTIMEIEEELTHAANRSVTAIPKFPLYFLFLSFLPMLWLLKHKLSSILPMLFYFNKHGFVGDVAAMKTKFPEYRMTPLSKYLNTLFKDKGQY